MTTTTIPDDQLQLLKAGDAQQRLRGIAALGRSGESRAIEPLGALLRTDPDADVRARAASALGQIGLPLGVAALGAALRDTEPEVRRRAVQALNQIADISAVEPLMSVLADADRDVRRWAARGLGKFGGASCLAALRPLRSDPNVVVQDEAAQAIHAIEDRISLEAQRNHVDELKERRDQTDEADVVTQTRLEGQIDLAQFGISRLQARVAAHEAIPVPEEGSEQDRARRSACNGLQRLIRELENLSLSVRGARLRDAWENQLREASTVQKAWEAAAEGLGVDVMRAELARLQANMETRSDEQKKELVELTHFSQEGYSIQLFVERIMTSLTESDNRNKAENWSHTVEAEYKLLRLAREQGDYSTSSEHHSNLQQLREQVEGLKATEDRAKRTSGRAVVVSLLVCAGVLIGGLYWLQSMQAAGRAAPALGVPYTVLGWSALGSLAAMLYQFLYRPVGQLDTIKWLVARPIQGVIMGSFLYLVSAAGLLVMVNPHGNGALPDVTTSLTDAIRPELAAVIAFLGGFSDKFADEMVRRATSVLSNTNFGSEPSTTARATPRNVT